MITNTNSTQHKKRVSLPCHVEDGVVGLADEEGAHGVEARVADGLAVLVGPLVRHQIGNFLKNRKRTSLVLGTDFFTYGK